jgi:hypothetical protein
MENRGKYCTNCGVHIDASARFCVQCGARQSPVDLDSAPVSQTHTPSGMFDILGETFGVYKRNFASLVAIAAIVKIPVAILGWLLFVTVDAPTTEDDFNFAFFLEIGIKGLVLAILGGLGWVLMQAALIHAIYERSLGRPIAITTSFAFARGRYLPMLGGLIVAGVAAILTAITIIGIPFAIAFGFYWSFVLQTASLEGYGPTGAMARSYDLVRGNWWWVLGFLIVSAILIGIISSIITGLIGLLIPVVGGLIGDILMAPLMIIAQTLFYFELRDRQHQVRPPSETPLPADPL